MRRGAFIIAAAAVAWVLSPNPARANCATLPELCNLPVVSTIAEPDFARSIDIVLVGDGFNTVSSWSSTAQSFISAFQSQNLAGFWPAHSDIFNFHAVTVISASTNVTNTTTTDTALGMVATGSQIITASGLRVSMAASNAPDADVVIAIANTSGGRANATFPNQMLSGGVVRMSKSTGPLTHELGHALLHLADEYVEASLCKNPSEAALVREPNTTTNSTCAKFSGTPGAACVQGSSYCSTGVFRPAADCLMRGSGNKAMCPVCAREREMLLLQRRTGTDAIEPWAVLTQPSAATPVSGLVQWSAVASDHGRSPVRLSFEVNGRLVNQSGWVQSSGGGWWDSRELPDGAYSANIVVEDGHHATSGHASGFAISNAADTTPPGIVVSTPTAGQVMAGKPYVFAQARAAQGSTQSATDIAAMWATLDGKLAAHSFLSAWLGTSLGPGDLPPGPHVVRVYARDWAGHTTSSDEIPFVSAPSSGGSGSGQPGGGINQGEGGSMWAISPPLWSPVGDQFGLLIQVSEPETALQLRVWHQGSLLLSAPVLPPTSSSASAAGGNINSEAWPPGPQLLRVELLRFGAPSEFLDFPVVKLPQDQSQGAAWLVQPHFLAGHGSGVQTVVAGGHLVGGVERVDVYFGQSLVCSIDGAAGSCTWDTSNVAQGCSPMRAIARGAQVAQGSQQASASSAPVSFCVDNTPPSARWAEPGAHGTLSAGVGVVLVAADGTGSPLWKGVLRADGEIIAETTLVTQGYLGWIAQLPASPGPMPLEAEVWDAAGNKTTITRILHVTTCATDASCSTLTPCMVPRCLPSGGCVAVRAPDCCASASDCEDNDPCTQDLCEAQGCVHLPVPGCCRHGFDCSDNNPCTPDVCEGNSCAQGWTCCPNNSDCNGGCGPAICEGASPAFCAKGSQTCCTDASDCSDNNPCTLDSCNQGQCAHAPQPGCCTSDVDCNDGDPCTLDACAGFTCHHAPIPSCCSATQACAVFNPCATYQCFGNSCWGTPEPNCCVFHSDCDDSDPCTANFCAAGECTSLAIPGCCGAAGGCAGCQDDYGDLNGDGERSVADVACAVLVSLWTLAGANASTNAQPPPCLAGPPARADLTCDDLVNVSDVIRSIESVLGLPLSPLLDLNGNNCPDACE